MVKDNEQSARESSIASGWTVEGQAETAKASAAPAEVSVGGAGDAVNDDAANGEGRAQLSNVALVLLGLLGGLYLLFMYVWFSWAGAVAATNAAVVDTSGSLGGALQQVVYYLAPFAPAFWFMTVLVLCRGAKVSRMLIWLLIGLVLLVPLPMFGGMF